MKSIEERAAWFADTFIESLTHGAAYRGYVLGATEQKAIDDELLKRVHKGVLDKAIKEKKELIDKACEWLAENIDSRARFFEDGVWVQRSISGAFRKAMEN